MSSDNKDKTVFRQSGAGSGNKSPDSTIIRPTPGRRSSGQTQIPRTSEQTRIQHGNQQQAERARLSAPGLSHIRIIIPGNLKPSMG